jgi:predicted enzyme related to lactoylglutathione lyase
MANNAVVWFEIYVQDMPRARAFYEAVLGRKLEKLEGPDGELEMWAFPMDPAGNGAGGALVKMKGVPSGPGGTLVYFACKDCAEEESRVVPNGGRVNRPKLSIGKYGFITLAVDPDGNPFGLYSMQ